MSNLPPSTSASLAIPVQTPEILPHAPSQPHNDRGRGRARSRGGLGKYLRARGRRGYGRPAEFSKRLLLDGEGPADNDADDEEAKQIEAENARKYSRRHLTSNADRYNEPEPELGSDGEPIVEPEIDLSTFLQKQKLSDDPASSLFSKEEVDDVDDDDIDHSIAPLVASNASRTAAQKKGKVTQIEWSPELDAIHREKLAADAARDLKERFRAKSDELHAKPVFSTSMHRKKADSALVEAPPLPLEQPSEPKDPMQEMESFLDELLQ